MGYILDGNVVEEGMGQLSLFRFLGRHRFDELAHAIVSVYQPTCFGDAVFYRHEFCFLCDDGGVCRFLPAVQDRLD